MIFLYGLLIPAEHFKQTLIEIFLPDLAQQIFVAITIAIENQIRINRTLLKIF
jgi:hypothetical protein